VPFSPSILVVDDDEEERRGFRRPLQELGYLVIEAATGREAENVVRERFFDLMILDLSMPDEDGIELIRAIRTELPRLQVLAVSGFMRGSFLHIAKKLGATSVLQKPVSEDMLIGEVSSLLASAF
jgi:two-component system, NarL family, invasion response regulator UvrY